MDHRSWEHRFWVWRGRERKNEQLYRKNQRPEATWSWQDADGICLGSSWHTRHWLLSSAELLPLGYTQCSCSPRFTLYMSKSEYIFVTVTQRTLIKSKDISNAEIRLYCVDSILVTYFCQKKKKWKKGSDLRLDDYLGTTCKFLREVGRKKQ